MGSLLRFARGVDKPFRFSVEVIGNTVFLVRKENSPTELIPDVRGYGHTFPDAYTTWEPTIKGSETHQRLIKYIFGGLQCLLRFECDGYINSTAVADLHKTVSATDDTSDENDLLQAFQATSVSQSLTNSDKPLIVEYSSGLEVDQASIFDLKTRSGRYKKEIDMADFLPIIYLKQIPNFIVAYHDGEGIFHPRDIKVQDLDKDIRIWEAENKTALDRFATLLHKIIDMARNDDKGLLEVYSPSPARLEIHRQYGDGVHALPLSLREAWDGTPQAPHENNSSDGTASDTENASSNEGVKIRMENGFDDPSDSDSDDGDKDFTACSVDSCGYCGRCSY